MLFWIWLDLKHNFPHTAVQAPTHILYCTAHLVRWKADHHWGSCRLTGFMTCGESDGQNLKPYSQSILPTGLSLYNHFPAFCPVNFYVEQISTIRTGWSLVAVFLGPMLTENTVVIKNFSTDMTHNLDSSLSRASGKPLPSDVQLDLSKGQCPHVHDGEHGTDGA